MVTSGLVLTIVSFAANAERSGSSPRPPAYTIRVLESASEDSSVANDINDTGQIVGYSGSLPVLWLNGEARVLGGETPDLGGANGVNNRSQVCGGFSDGVRSFRERAFLWQDGSFTRIEPPPGRTATRAVAINDAGIIAGWARAAEGDSVGFVWDSKESLLVIPTPPGFGDLFPTDLNSHGVVFGYTRRERASLWGFRFSDGILQTLAPADIGFDTGDVIVRAANDRGVAVGYIDRNFDRIEPFVWDEGSVALLDPAIEGFATELYPLDIDGVGAVVGTSGDGSFGDRPEKAAVLWYEATAYNLNDLIVGDSPLELLEGRAINENGSIVGYGVDPDGIFRAFVAHPVSARFLRADSNGDSEIDISDAIGTLRVLFLEFTGFVCEDAADADDSGAIELLDAIHTFQHIFLGDALIPGPGPTDCNWDTTEDTLGCSAYPDCGW